MSETDNDAVLKMIQEAEENGGLDKLVGKTITNQDQIRMVPDILQNGDEFFFLNLDTMTERIQQSSRHFIQSVFRMRLEKGRSNWYSARVTQIPATTETEYLLTVQIIPPHLSKWIDQFMEENRNQ